jgi:hypothetical protein
VATYIHRMTTEWTRGPWFFHSDGRVTGPEGVVIAECDAATITSALGFSYAINPQERLANQALISAAPDLATALQGMVTMYLALVDSGDCGNWDAREDKAVVAAVRALTKAGAGVKWGAK